MPAISKYTLAIETATSLGSLSLLCDEDEIGSWIGSPSEPMSSALLPQISVLLEYAGIKINDLSLLAVCSGPGSYTGVRIGLSTVKGIQAGIGTQAVAVTLMEALAFAAKITQGSIACLVPAGRDEAYYQQFRRDADVPGAAAETGIASLNIESIPPTSDFYIASPDFKKEYAKIIEDRAGKPVVLAAANMAKAIGNLGILKLQAGLAAEEKNLSPAYLKDFGGGWGITRGDR